MSSSAEQSPPYGWEVFADRPAPAEMELASPAAELVSVLQRYRSALGAERGKARAAADDALAAAVDQAVLVARLDVAMARHRDVLDKAGLGRVHRELRVLKDQMIDALRAGGVTIEDPLGEPLAKVADRIEVIGWRHGAEFPGEVVAETHGAIVLYRGAVIRPGQVTLGAPPPTGNDERRERE